MTTQQKLIEDWTQGPSYTDDGDNSKQLLTGTAYNEISQSVMSRFITPTTQEQYEVHLIQRQRSLLYGNIFHTKHIITVPEGNLEGVLKRADEDERLRVAGKPRLISER